MLFKRKKGITLTENLMTIGLLGILVMTAIGGFVIAKSGAIRARHRVVAMGIIREYMEKEISKGYYYADQYFTFASADPVTATVDGITYSITPQPYPPTDSTEGSTHYKTIGFQAQWTEPVYGASGTVSCSERAVTYVAQHS